MQLTIAGCSIGVGLATGQVGGHQGAGMGQRVVAAQGTL